MSGERLDITKNYGYLCKEEFNLQGGQASMDLVKAIDSRRSIRAFKPDPVSKEIIDKILSLVIKAPSAINLQPWEFIVVMGEEKKG